MMLHELIVGHIHLFHMLWMHQSGVVKICIHVGGELVSNSVGRYTVCKGSTIATYMLLLIEQELRRNITAAWRELVAVMWIHGRLLLILRVV